MTTMTTYYFVDAFHGKILDRVECLDDAAALAHAQYRLDEGRGWPTSRGTTAFPSAVTISTDEWDDADETRPATWIGTRHVGVALADGIAAAPMFPVRREPCADRAEVIGRGWSEAIYSPAWPWIESAARGAVAGWVPLDYLRPGVEYFGARSPSLLC